MKTSVILKSEISKLSGGSTVEQIMSGNIETPFYRVRVSENYSEKILTLKPLRINITLDEKETYTAERERLDCAILSAFFHLPVEGALKYESNSVNQDEITLEFFIKYGEPLWINPDNINFYIYLLDFSYGMRLVSNKEEFSVASAIDSSIVAKKHPVVDVWYEPA
jgi:hypothetical protein